MNTAVAREVLEAQPFLRDPRYKILLCMCTCVVYNVEPLEKTPETLSYLALTYPSIIQWMYRHGWKLNEQLVDREYGRIYNPAIGYRGASLGVMKWMHKNMIMSTKGGSLIYSDDPKTLLWLLTHWERAVELPRNSNERPHVNIAILNGRLDTVHAACSFYKGMGVRADIICNQGTMDFIMYKNCLDVLKYMYGQLALDLQMYDFLPAIKHGHFEIVMWAWKRGAKIDYGKCAIQAGQLGCRDVKRWAEAQLRREALRIYHGFSYDSEDAHRVPAFLSLNAAIKQYVHFSRFAATYKYPEYSTASHCTTSHYSMNDAVVWCVSAVHARSKAPCFAAAIVMGHRPEDAGLVGLLPINTVNFLHWACLCGYHLAPLDLYSWNEKPSDMRTEFAPTSAYKRCNGASLQALKWVRENEPVFRAFELASQAVIYNDDPETFLWMLPYVSKYRLLDPVITYGNFENLHTLWRYCEHSILFSPWTYFFISAYGRLDMLKYTCTWEHTWRPELYVDVDLALKRGHHELYKWITAQYSKYKNTCLGDWQSNKQ